MAQASYKSVTQLFSESSKIVRKNLAIFIFLNIMTVLSAAWDIGTMLRDKTNGSSYSDVFKNGLFGDGGQYPHAGGAAIITLIILATLVLWIMKTILVVRAANGKRLDVGEIWEEFKVKGLRVFAVSLVSGLFIVIGFILFIIPGILILPRLIMAPYVLIDQNVGVREAINRSWDLAQGKFSPIYAVILFSILLSLPAILPIVGPILSTALAILFSVAMPLRYLELKKAAKK